MNTATDNSAQAILQRGADDVAEFLERVLAQAMADVPPTLTKSIRYSLFAGGKRIRPVLVLETHRCVSSLLPHPSSLDSALAAAAAIELIHTFSLVHDDLPAMDDDAFRRGVPTNHKVFGEAMAILAGDAMVTLAFEVLAGHADPGVSPKLVLELARASGPLGMIGGQVLDIESENKSLPLDQLRALHAKKTGALLTCACRMGAISARATDPQLESLTAFGRHLGLAFQIVDDLLDVTATKEQLGKATQKDAKKGKNTYPSLLGLEGAKAEARSQLSAAMDALTSLGNAAEGLRNLCRFVVEREK